MTNEISTEEQQQQQQVHQPTPPKGLVKNRRAIFEQAQQQQQQQVHQPSPPKGLVKNKRAIFEQAQQQQQQQAHQPTLARRSSGAIITKRVDTFKSLDFGTSAVSSSVIDSTTNNSAVKKLANSFADQVSIGTGGNQVTRSPAPIVIRKEVEQVTLTREEDIFSSAKETAAPSAEEDVTTTSDHHVSSIDAPASPSQSPRPQLQQNGGNKEADVSQDENGNSENSFSEKSPEKTADNNTTSEVITNEELIMNGQNSNIKAIALFDYQAADNTEISFDPDDKIGQIQKVDPGWWHGQVISGRFKGQIGLFPSNYVQEL